MGTSRTGLSTREPGGIIVFFRTPDPDLELLPESGLEPPEDSGITPSLTSDFDDEPLSFLIPLSLAGLNSSSPSRTKWTSLSIFFPCPATLGVLLEPCPSGSW